MIQPAQIREHLEANYSRKKIEDEDGLTGEWSLGVQDVLDIIIDLNLQQK